MPSISTITLRIKLFTNFQDEPILFTKNLFHTDDKEFSFALLTPAIGEYPYIATNVFYKSDLFSSSSKYKLKDIAEIIFNEDKLIGYLTSKYGKPKESIGIYVNDKDKNCVDNKCTSEIIQNNVLITLMSLFPVSFPTINNIIDSHTLLFGSTAPHFFSSTTMNEVITNKFYNTRYSYLKTDNQIFTFSKLIWLNDVLNHPYYNKFIKKYHKYYQYILNNYEKPTFNLINEYIDNIDGLIIDIIMGPYENVFIPFVTPNNITFLSQLMKENNKVTKINDKEIKLFGGITTRSQTRGVNKTVKQPTKLPRTFFSLTPKTRKKLVKFQNKSHVTSIELLTQIYKNNILTLIYIKHITLKLMSDNPSEINVEYVKNIFYDIYDNISQQLEEKDEKDTFKIIRNEIRDVISGYTGNVGYNSEYANEDLLEDKNWIINPNDKSSSALNNLIKQSVSLDSTSSGWKIKNIDELYENDDDIDTKIKNFKTFYTHLFILSQQNIAQEFITTKINRNYGKFELIKNKYSSKYDSDMKELLKPEKLRNLISNIENNYNLKMIKNINQVKQKYNELSKIGEVIEFSQLTNEYGRNSASNKYGASSNKLLEDLIVQGKLISKKNNENIADLDKYSKYYPKNDITSKYLHDFHYLESIYTKFYEGESVDVDDTMLKYIMNTGINIKTDIETGKKWSEIYVIADFLEGEINDENISEMKCKYYNEKLGLLIDDMVDQDNEMSDWNVQSSRLYIRKTPDEQYIQDGVNNQYLQKQGNEIPLPGQPGIVPPQAQRMPSGQIDKVNKVDEENVTRNFTNFVLENNIIKENLIDYNNKNRQIEETALGKHIQEKNPQLFDLLRTWNNLENNKFNVQFVSNYRIKVSKVKSDIDQEIESDEIRLKQPNINQDQEYQIKSRRRRYQLYKVILEQIKLDGDSIVSESKT